MKKLRGCIVLALLLGFGAKAEGQVNRYMVFFTDKEGTPYAVSNPGAFLSSKAIERRQKAGIIINEQDLPVNPAYISALRQSGIDVYFITKWLNGVLIQCDQSQVAAVQALAFVGSVVQVAPGALLSPGSRRYTADRSEIALETTSTLATDEQLNMLGIDSMQHDGYRGESITIAVLDAGFPGVNSIPYFEPLLTQNRIDLEASFDFTLNRKDVFTQNSHGTKVLSIIGGLAEGAFIGGAYNADFQLYITEYDPTEYRIEEYNWLFAAERADSAGADIITTSLGYTTFDDAGMDYQTSDMDGHTSIIARAAELAFSRGILVVAAAGNEGASAWHIIATPADAPNVIAVGNINAFGFRSSTSSVGPTADGRTKPDVVALGTDVAVVSSSGSITGGSGTSFAAPLVTALAAGLWQQHPELTNSTLSDLLRKSASQSAKPDNDLGYGIPSYMGAGHYLDRQDQNSTFAVYPNPVGSTLTISPKDPDIISSCTFDVINALGIIVQRGSISFTWRDPEFHFEVGMLPCGIYFVRIRHGVDVNSYRVVKD